MKIGIPKIRVSRKVLIIALGLVILLGGGGTAALYFTTDLLSGEEKAEEQLAGSTCTDIQTMVLKTPSKRLWLRKYIRMDDADGIERVRTALRIAGLLAKDNAVDLIHVSVIDAKGPDKRAEMRARAIGAEVLIAMKPQNLPAMAEPAVARYYEGSPSTEGKFYGERVSLDFSEIRTMMTAMRAIPDKEDCAKPEPTEEEKAAEAKKNEHGAKKSDHGEKPAEHGEKSAEHGEKPAEHGEKPVEHGAEPKDGETAAEDHGAVPAKEKGFVDNMLGMIGLGGDEAPAEHAPATEHKTDGEAPAEEHEAAGDHEANSDDAKPAEHGEDPAQAADDPSADHETAAKEPAKEPVKEKSFLDGMMDMVGLGSDEPVADVPKEMDHGDQAAADGEEKPEDQTPDDHKPTEHKGDDQAGEHAPADHAETDAHAKPADEHAARDAHQDETVTEEPSVEDGTQH